MCKLLKTIGIFLKLKAQEIGDAIEFFLEAGGGLVIGGALLFFTASFSASFSMILFASSFSSPPEDGMLIFLGRWWEWICWWLGFATFSFIFGFIVFFFGFLLLEFCKLLWSTFGWKGNLWYWIWLNWREAKRLAEPEESEEARNA